ncbi:MAG: CRISPR-associated helicase Cas3' [Syntrophomonadaceae bacterium]|jgi:CRISPR-associated endonuclease/helicase Cas3|nr:CRISPR-associated helicase Cas3' [Syntrophomonadaceae bacterium]
MQKDIFAHSANKSGQWQLLEDHLQMTASMAESFAESFNSAGWAYNIGLLHDLGKASDAFQEYLKKVSNVDSDEDGAYVPKTNHSSAGAVYSVERYKEAGKIMAYCIAGHHAGLADWYPGKTKPKALSQRLNEDRQYYEELKPFAIELSNLLKNFIPPPFIKTEEDFHLWIRMLFSCLVDADFLDTEQHMSGDKERGLFLSIPVLSDIFLKYLGDFTKSAKQTNINKIRLEILEACKHAADTKSGFFEITVPTGGGKTLSSLAFAFKHALKYKKTRIIYVIPYTSIIEQTAKILKSILGEDNVIEHHSNIDPEKETEKSRLACENWDAPIIVTTNVQFFESLYANKPSKCRKLHNIANSIIILDEAQMLPPELLYPVEEILTQLINNYKCSIVFSTATQPYFEKIENITKIVPASMCLYEKLKRVNYHFPQADAKKETWENVAEKLERYKQVLCVVNTRRDCYELYKLMPFGTIHLSALMCAEHRSKKIELIKEKLKRGEEIRVISTQLIEAGVDIDFPVVFRAFAGLTSIIQTAGRCNREGKMEKGKVFIFNPPKLSPAGLMRKSEDAAREIISSDNFEIDNVETARKFFRSLIKRANYTGDKEFKEMLVKDAQEGKFQFATYAEEFSIIDNNCAKPVIVEYNKSIELINHLRYGSISRNLMRKLQRYTVNLPENKFKELEAAGLIEETPNGIFVQSVKGFYGEDCGLNVFAENYGIDIGII